jgi:hypothetical protein
LTLQIEVITVTAELCPILSVLFILCISGQNQNIIIYTFFTYFPSKNINPLQALKNESISSLMVVYGNVMEQITDSSRSFAKLLYIPDTFVSLANHLLTFKIFDSHTFHQSHLQ